jgi:hypothetical protein
MAHIDLEFEGENVVMFELCVAHARVIDCKMSTSCAYLRLSNSLGGDRVRTIRQISSS